MKQCIVCSGEWGTTITSIRADIAPLVICKSCFAGWLAEVTARCAPGGQSERQEVMA